MISNDIYSFAGGLGGGFFAGILIGYALKKVIKLAAVIVGLFFAVLAYLQYQQIATINWDKLQAISNGAIITLANATTQLSNNNMVGGGGSEHTTTSIAMSNLFGIPLTGSMAIGFTIGFMKG
jgi:uncharacterized membrane protein (Fun14 family)